MTQQMQTVRCIGLAGFLLLVLTFQSEAQSVAPNSPLALWYRAPANRWLEALPVGNGRLGVMIYGAVTNEILGLNESTCWSGGPRTDNDNANGATILPQLQTALLPPVSGNVGTLWNQFHGNATGFGTSRPFGNLAMTFAPGTGSITNYRRSLDLATGVAEVSYACGGVNFTRQIFVSNPDQVIVVQLTADQLGKIAFTAQFQTVANNGGTGAMQSAATNVLLFNGKPVTSGGQSVNSHGRLFALNSGGTVSSGASGLTVTNADSVTLLLALGTTFDGNNPTNQCLQQIAAAATNAYATLLGRHTNDYQALFNRVALNLGANVLTNLPTDQRKALVDTGASDPGFDVLNFQYARYLTISGARTNSPLPMHLQGIWNDNLAANMVWTCDFHLDINTEQNQWLATSGNLPEANVPLANWLKNKVVPSGTRTALTNYGKPGWVVHFTSNPWGWSAVDAATDYCPFHGAGPWIASELWKQFEFTGDTNFLSNYAYPILKGSAQFYLAFLTNHPTTGQLVTAPSCSPEHGGLRVMPTVDRVVIYDLFTEVMNCCDALGVDAAFRSQVAAARGNLPPFKISQYGQLQEWYEDSTDGNDGHRHTSHLTSVFPYDQITPEDTPTLASAALLSLQRRLNNPGWENTEWSAANAICYFARFKDGTSAYQQLRTLSRTLTDTNLMTFSPAGIAGAADNIFAIDGNTAAAAGVNEMLLQSHRQRLEFLPALPSAWANGGVSGVGARGAFTVDLAWQNGLLTSAVIHSKNGNICNLKRTNSKTYDLTGATILEINGAQTNAVSYQTQNNLITFSTSAGRSYLVVPAVLPLIAPSGMAATRGNNLVALTWLPVAGALTYNLKRATASGGPYTTIASGFTGTNFVDTAAPTNSMFFYVVSAVNANTESLNSNEAGVPSLKKKFAWSAPAPVTTADATLNLFGTVVGATVFGATAKTVTLGNGTNLVFKNDGSVAAVLNATVPAGGSGLATGAFSGATGNANFDAVLTQFSYDGGPKTIQLKNLTPGKNYSVQLFALDNRSGSPGARLANFQDPDDAGNVSATFTMNNNFYVVGSFTAPSNGVSATVNVNLQENLPTGPGFGNINALVIRALPSMFLDWQRLAGGQLELQWSQGILQEATNLGGPWFTNLAGSPFSVTPTGAQKFFRVQIW